MIVNTYEGLLALLVENDVRFMLVGGLAVCLNGFTRTTQHVDILVDNEAQNLQRLLNTLVHFGQGYARELNLGDFTDEEGAVRIQEDFDLDIFVRMGGKTYSDLSKSVDHYVIENGPTIPFLNAEELIRLKKSSLRDKDRIDVAALSTILKEKSKSKAASGLSLDTFRQIDPRDDSK